MELLELLQALGESHRLAIVNKLRNGPLPAGRIAEGFAISRTAVSQHLAVLRQSQLVIQEKRATQRIYRLNPQTLSWLSDRLGAMAGGDWKPDASGSIDSNQGDFSVRTSVPGHPPAPVPSADTVPDSNVIHESAAMQPAPVAATGVLGRREEVAADISVRAEPDAIYQCLTDPRLLRQWFAAEVDCEASEGGGIGLSDGFGVTVKGQFLSLQPGQRLVFTWGGVEGLADGESQVDIQLRTSATGTQVVLRHSRLPERLLATYENVWRHSVLPNLRDMAEGRLPASLCIGTRDG
jgi:uncharacterized protein YndB with AHSA1/START domain/DNA-binding transcriptional ArsR family regulator